MRVYHSRRRGETSRVYNLSGHIEWRREGGRERKEQRGSKGGKEEEKEGEGERRERREEEGREWESERKEEEREGEGWMEGDGVPSSRAQECEMLTKISTSSMHMSAAAEA